MIWRWLLGDDLGYIDWPLERRRRAEETTARMFGGAVGETRIVQTHAAFWARVDAEREQQIAAMRARTEPRLWRVR